MPEVIALGPTSGYFIPGKVKDTAVIFTHGIPFNASFWLPVMEKLHLPYSCYSLDLKGFGFSAEDQEVEGFSLMEQLSWLESQIESIPAKKLIFVMHGWSSVPATLLAQRISQKVKAIVYFEAQIRAAHSPDMLSLPMQMIAQQLMSIENLEQWVLEDNGYPELLFPIATIGCLQAIKKQFSEQFKSKQCRQAILQYLYELPLGFKKSHIVEKIDMNAAFLCRSKFPKCLIYAMPGLMTTIETVGWAKNNIQNISIIDLGYSMHCAPLTIAEDFSKELNSWIKSINSYID